MTQDELIEMARQVGVVPIGFNKTTMQKEYSIFFNELEAFAKLVAEKAFKDGYAIGETAGFKQAIKLERARGQANG